MDIIHDSTIPSDLVKIIFKYNRDIPFVLSPSDNDECARILRLVFKYLIHNESNSNESLRMHFSGEFDSNQTQFEHKSNLMEVGVISRNTHCAKVMLAILRCIVDDRIDDHELLLWRLENNEYINIEKVIKIIGKGESPYYTSFELTDTYVSKLCGVSGTQIIKKQFQDVKAFNLALLLDEYIRNSEYAEYYEDV